MAQQFDFQWSGALRALLGRFPSLEDEPQLGALLQAQDPPSIRHILDALQGLLIRPSLTLGIGSCFRPVLLSLVSAFVDARLSGATRSGPSHAAVSVALISLLDLAPQLERVVVRYMEAAEPPFHQLLAGPTSLLNIGSPAEPITQVHMARAAMRMLQMSPGLRDKWSLAPIQALLLHIDADVRWAGVECMAILTNMSDAGKESLRAQVLSSEEALASALRWQQDRLRYTVEDACLWMQPPAHFSSAAGSETSRGPGSSSVVPLSGMAEPALPASGFVSLCGVELPCRSAPGLATAAHSRTPFVKTETVARNLEAAALVLCQQRALLLEGPPGSGKSAVVEELAAATGNSDFIHVHVDDQMDAKSLLGAYVCTAVPGEFVWQPGPLTQAVLEGKWLVIEDINLAPMDVLAALIPLLERRELQLPQRAQSLSAADGFQLLATITSSPGGGSGGAYGSSQGVRDLLGSLLASVTVQTPTGQEQLAILSQTHPLLAPLLPPALATLSLIRLAAGQATADNSTEWSAAEEANGWDSLAGAALESAGLHAGDAALHVGRHFSMRDVLKWCRRMQSVHAPLLQRSVRTHDNPDVHSDVSLLPVAMREAAFLESADCYTAMIAKPEARRRVLTAMLAVWALPENVLEQYLVLKKPMIQDSGADVVVGRAVLPKVSMQADQSTSKKVRKSSFARTGQAMRAMEAVAVATAQQEPVLLVGETGTGKTTLVQQIAEQVGTNLVVLNLSQQTDSADLLGGFQPVEPRHALLPLLDRFQGLVRRTWDRGNNDEFLGRAIKYAQRRKWSSLLKAFHTAIGKVEAVDSLAAEGQGSKRPSKKKKMFDSNLREDWAQFKEELSAAERAAKVAEGGFAFAFKEGALVQALRNGDWVLLDEINLAPSEALERLAGLLENERASITLMEKGTTDAVPRQANFRLFAAMNPATDAGKRELPAALRNRFTEIFVAEPSSREDLRGLVAAYLRDTVPNPPLDAVVDFYLAAKLESERKLVDGAGSKPTYNLRTLCRALEYARTVLPVYGLLRALYDGCSMAFHTQLSPSSAPVMEGLLQTHILGAGTKLKALLRAPAPPQGGSHVLFDHFWVEAGDQPLPEPSAEAEAGRVQFVATPSVQGHLRSLSRAALTRRYPVLLQGPTSSGKTSLVTHLARATGHRCVRINNHEQTDLQEYLGSYVADEAGRLVFREGALVTAVRAGHWVILDELNLAPSEVLEALNRLLDDNRELYVPELGEMVRPHPHFMLFATQNPAGAYGGRKALSRAFRSRFLELHVGDIPDSELAHILQLRCALAPSYAAKLVAVMRELQRLRQATNVFAGKHGFITPRDLFKWAGRGAVGYQELGENGCLLLAERLRDPAERDVVQKAIEDIMRVKIDPQELYQREGGEPQLRLQQALQLEAQNTDAHKLALQAALSGIVWTASMRRMYTLVDRCLENAEPVLLVGETGTGKTTVCQMAALMRGQRLHILNCNQHTEVSDFLGGFRPARDRAGAFMRLESAIETIRNSPLVTRFNMDVPAAPTGLEAPDLLDTAKAAAKAVHTVLIAVQNDGSAHDMQGLLEDLQRAASEAMSAAVAARAPFQWVDGPLVTAMRQGDIILIDELNLAKDAVLERMNSVLEPGRTLTLAEKGGAGAEEVVAAAGFRLVATMNPGGDYGKRELSPALANRFTTVWVPPIEDEAELAQILNARVADEEVRQEVAGRLLDFWRFFRVAAGPAAGGALSVRDLLAWAGFVNAAAPRIGALAAYAHGAHLVLLDGIGLGIGLPTQTAQRLHAMCQEKLLQQLPEAARPAALAAAGHMVLDTSDAHPQHSAGPHDEDPNAMNIDNAPCTTVAQGVTAGVASPSSTWGIPPFFVERGPHSGAQSGAAFDFRAPTTARNALRVLRALQLKRSVLLEGSPGVGKTALVAALARASGRRHVRINLSEQTDIMDLLGADLPVEGGLPGQFAWCDGPLLAALKAGDWVLLDELNLAGQSVLEGLNALLDHRAEVFIPELGSSFQCPPTFRIFAAQNPVQEGGGRRGLPKSFLNRFTRVHVELLDVHDLQFIAGSLHPAVPASVRQRMIAFLQTLHVGANEARSFGGVGGPWEFNLRDLLRWCQLVETVTGAKQPGVGDDVEEAAAAHFARLLFLQRMRAAADRAFVSRAFAEHWGTALPAFRRPPILASPEAINIGWATLQRAQQGTGTKDDLQLLQGQGAALESLAQCMQLSWMCILVGPSGSGKTSLAHVVAGLAGQELVEIALTSSTDTSDLLGGFEQLEPRRQLQEAADEVGGLVSRTVGLLLCGTGRRPSDAADPSGLADRLRLSKDISHAWMACKGAVSALSDAPSLDTGILQQALGGLQRVLTQLANTLAACPAPQLEAEAAAELTSQISKSSRAVADLTTALLERIGDGVAGRFEWVDGALTRAIEEGRWVLLDNANMCSATVLDRLNPLLEPAGALLLNEAGTANGRPRVLQPHPNFRLILALDPKHGELSRAMRNRGIEVFVADAPADEGREPGASGPLLGASETSESQDLMAVLALQGVPGSALPRAMVAAHLAVAQEAARCHRRRPSARELKQWASLARLLCERGRPVAAALATAWRHAYVSTQPSPDARAFAAAVFERHCAGASADAAPANPLALSLHRPAAWPKALSAAGIAADSQLAALEVDAAVLTHLIAQIGAAEAASLAAAPGGVSSAFGAAALPAPMLMAHLQGDALEGGATAALVQSIGGHEALEAGVEGGLRLLRFAVLCFAERASTLDWQCRLQWLSSIKELADGLATGCTSAREAIGQASKAVRDALGHAIFQELLQLWPTMQDLLEAILPPDAQTAARSRPLLPGTLAMVLQESVWSSQALILSARHSSVRLAAMHASLMSAVLEAAGAAASPSVLQLSYTRYINPQVRARTTAPHPVLDSIYPAFAALSAFEAALLDPHSAPQIQWTPQLAQQVALFQELRDALWELAHGGLTSRAAPAALSVQEEPFAFAWLRLTKALRGIAAAAPGIASLREAERLAGIVDQVNGGLGMQSGPPPKPLLWRGGGHPSNPPSLELWNASRQLHLLCNAARAPATGDFGDNAAAAQLVPRTHAGMLEGGEEEYGMQTGPDGEPRVSRETVAAVAAALSSDWGLRRALLEGAGLFAMAAALAAGRKGTSVAGKLGDMEPEQAASSALAIVSALEERVKKAIEQALTRVGDERAVIRNAAPLLDKPLDDGVLPEVFPTQLMASDTTRSLQHELLTFQDHWTLQSQRQVLLAATVMLLSQQRADPSGMKDRMRTLVLPGCMAAGRSIDDFAPLQLLLWLLDAEEDRATVQQQLPQLTHEMWYFWHAALWDCKRGTQSPTALTQSSLSGLVGAILDASRKSSLAMRTAKSLQLRLAARHVSKWSTERALPAGAAAAAMEWASLGALLATIFAAHRPSLPDASAREALDAAVASLLELTAAQGPDTPSASEEGLRQQIRDLLASSSHSLLVQLLQPVLLPLLALVLEGSQATRAAGPAAAYGAQTLSLEAKRGAAWVLLGAARLHLASPPPGTDPAAKYAHKRAHLLAVLEDVLAGLEVRRALQRLPLGPDESHSIAVLEERAAAMRARAEELRAQTVPRPQPSQYPALQQELARFMHNLGSVQRIVALLQALQAGQQGAADQAGVWQQNADAWASRLLPAFPLYADLLQPVALAVYEMRAGFSMLAHAHTALQTVGTSLELGAVLAQLMAFPATNLRSGASLLCSPAAVSVTAATARQSQQGQSAAGAEVAVYSARLNVLRAALHSAAQAVLGAAPSDSTAAMAIAPSMPSGPMAQFEAVLTALLGAWEEVKAAEEARAALEAQLFKTKTQSTTILTEEEEEEADYKQTFPDHSAAFADILDAEGDEGMLEPAAPAADEQATEAEAGSAAAHALLQGDLLEDIVQEHTRVFRHVAGAQDEAGQLDSRMVFKHAYDLGALLMSKHATAGGVLPPELDERTAAGHLMRICLEQQRLSEAPAATSSDAAAREGALDMEKPSLAEAGLMEEPVQALRARLEQLMADWPDHPILSQLLVLCDRLVGMVAEAPLKAALTGLELLLARSQVWQETAASHVSLAPQLERLAALALRWRRLQLAAWRSLIRTLAQRHAAGAHRSWFHLYRMLMAPGEADAEQDTAVAVAVEQFMQSATLGEYQRRLDLIGTFRCQAAAKGSAVQTLVAILENVHAYYNQFSPLVDKAIKDSLAPIEKRLEDFVKLAKWEDRGYHSLKQSTEKAQRQLHKLQRQAIAALKQPSAAVLADAAKSMGMADLTAPEAVLADSARQRRRKPEAAPPTELELTAQAAQDAVHWRAFCTAVIADLQASAVHVPAANETDTVRPDGSTLYRQRIPQLAQRMQDVLASSLDNVGHHASHAGSLDALAGEVAQRALDLRGAADKGARSRKKKALTDLLHALAAAGLSRQRSAVPSVERSVHAWFTQASPGALLEHLLGAEAGSHSALPTESVAQARALWSKADVYYYRNVARIQRLWQAAQAPSKDLSQREVAAAQRLSEHALFLQRRQRAFLGRLSTAAERLRSLSSTLSDFSASVDAPPAVPPQEAYRVWAQKQAQQLDDLNVLVGGSAQLLEAFSAVENAPQPNKQLKDAGGCLQRCHMEILASKQALQSVLLQCNTSAVLTPAHARIILHNQEVLQRSEADLSAAEHIHAYSKTVPNWSKVQQAVANAAMDGVQLQAAACTFTAPTEACDMSSEPMEAWSIAMEAAVTSILLWAQAAQASGPTKDSKNGTTEEGVEEERPPSITEMMKDLEGHAALQRLDATCNAAEALTAQIAALGTPDAPAGAGAMAAQSAALAPLLGMAAGALQAVAARYLALHKALAKLGYVAASLFVGLMQEGFCTAEASEEEAVGGEGGSFKEAEGTGMGEGEGAKDVSDQITDEDQLLGAQQKDQPADAPKEEEEAKQQPEEEQDVKGVEMEGDFQGDIHDVPSDAENSEEEENEDEDGEKLDQEMGDVGEQGEVVDERMWGDEDKPEPGQKPGEEKYEKDAPVQVDDKKDLEYQAGQEEEAGGEQGKEPQEKDGKGEKDKKAPDEAPAPDQEAAEEEQREEGGEGPINEDTEEGYEQRQFAAPQAPEEELELPEDMALDGEQGDKEGQEGNEEEAGAEHPDDAVQQPFPEGADKEEAPADGQEQEEQGPDTAPPDEGPPEEAGADAADEAAAKALEEGGGDQALDESAEPGEEEEVEPAAQHGWDEEQPEQDALPEAGPTGLASQAAAAQAAAQPDARGVGDTDKDEADAAGGQDQGAMAEDLSAPATPPQAHSSRMGASESGRQGRGRAEAAQGGDQPPSRQEQALQQANPYRSLGDAMEQWRRRLSVTMDSAAPDAGDGATQDHDEDMTNEDNTAGGNYEFIADGDRKQAGDTQALAPATEEQAREAAAPESGAAGGDADEAMPDAGAASDEEEAAIAQPEGPDEEPQQALRGSKQQKAGANRRAGIAEDEEDEDMGEDAEEEGDLADGQEGSPRGEEGHDAAMDSFVASLLQRTSLNGGPGGEDDEDAGEVSTEEAAALRAQMEELLRQPTASDDADAQYGRDMWARCEALTAGLAGELAEQLRLILEPTHATRLAGEYRSGKRLNMRRVIAYIASHFRKDKIWLRRTRPDQRTYQVVLAVDDSRSMAENGCGGFALEAVTLLARALARLEVGQLGVLRFGGTDHVRLLHALDAPFTDANGPAVLSALRFDQDNTLADRPMVELLTMLMHMLDLARANAAAHGSAQQLHQLVLVLADGRFHEKDSLRRMVMEAASRPGVLLAFIILDNPAASVLDMQAVQFVGGQPTFSKYLDSFPFPFYIVLRDLASLPSTLASLLRQWFELSAAGAMG